MPTNFLATTGTNGFLTAAAVTALSSGTTTINSLANAGFIVSTGTYTQTNTASGLMGYVTLTIGSTFVSGPGGNVTGWFLDSFDGGTTYESTVPGRPPDFIVPLTTSTSTAGGTPSSGSGVYPSQLVQMPWAPFKVLIQNNTGVTLGSSGQAVAFQSVAVQY